MSVCGVLEVVPVEKIDAHLDCNVYGCKARPTHTLRIGGGNMVTVERLCRGHLVELGQRLVYALGDEE
jgi:hypothetical protein